MLLQLDATTAKKPHNKTSPGTKKYLRLLYDSAANLLSFQGYTPKKVFEAVKEQKQATISGLDQFQR